MGVSQFIYLFIYLFSKLLSEQEIAGMVEGTFSWVKEYCPLG